MKKTLISIAFGVMSSMVCAQPSRTLPPLPPPPNPAAVPNLGSPSFYIFRNNMLPTQPAAPASNGLVLLKPVDGQLSIPATAPSGQVHLWQLPRSFESSIQGLQFIKPESVK